MPSVTPINFEGVQQAFQEAPALAARFVKTAMFRFARRVTKRTKTDYLSGRPGIIGGPWRRVKDKNVQGFTVGRELTTLKAVSKVSRLVRTHVEGATITAKSGGFLFLSRKTGKAGGAAVFARVKSVTIPARIPFERVWRAQLGRGTTEIGDALHRAVSQALDQRMKALTSVVQRVVNG